MYTMVQAMKPIEGMVDVTIMLQEENAAELAAAWGLFRSHRGRREKWTIEKDHVVFRMKRSTFSVWLDIVESVTEQKAKHVKK